MSVIEGLRRIQVYWPQAMFKMLGQERLDVLHRRLNELARGPAPADLRELIRRMDEAGLGIRGNTVILSD